jgi:hypothetical protein
MVAVSVKYPFRLDEVIPKTLWNDTDEYFFKPERELMFCCSVVLALRFEVQFTGELARTIVVLCDYRSFTPAFKVFEEQDYSRQAKAIFQLRNQEESISWEDLDNIAPELMSLRDSTIVIDGENMFRISVILVGAGYYIREKLTLSAECIE